ncbi:hypothetical protein SRABI128_06267 [Microbacterium sp. Bi128]|nr:hypothetical protein SRABI128_06267 [Microbacterium sp. Bi128]
MTDSNGPETSRTPTMSPVKGSRMGDAVQAQSWWVRTRCSAEKSCAGAPVTKASLMAFVPTPDSDQSAPSTNSSESASRKACLLPTRHSTSPSWSVTISRWRPVTVSSARSCDSAGITAASRWLALRDRASETSCRCRGRCWSGLMPRARERCQDLISDGERCGSGVPEIVVSCAARRIRAYSAGAENLRSEGCVMGPLPCRMLILSTRPRIVAPGWVPAAVGQPARPPTA